jgi:hypothetical protein
MSISIRQAVQKAPGRRMDAQCTAKYGRLNGSVRASRR